MDAEQYLVEQAERIETEFPNSKCRLRLAGGLRAVAADLRDSTTHQFPAYMERAYSHPKSE